MTMVRPLIQGWIKNMYIFHCNVVKSCDLAWYLVNSVGLLDEGDRIMQTKRDACWKMWGLYFTEQIPRSLLEIPGWIYLYQPWQDYIRFHLETAEYHSLNWSDDKDRTLECINNIGQDPITGEC